MMRHSLGSLDIYLRTHSEVNQQLCFDLISSPVHQLLACEKEQKTQAYIFHITICQRVKQLRRGEWLGNNEQPDCQGAFNLDSQKVG